MSLCVVVESEGGSVESPVEVFLMSNPGIATIKINSVEIM